jgi:hypothetical protein
MTADGLDSALALILGLSEEDGELPERLAQVRARLADRLTTKQSVPISPARLAAYASGTLDEAERRRFEDEMSASEKTYHGVASTLDFIKRVAEQDEKAPAGLVEETMEWLRSRGAEAESTVAPIREAIVVFFKTGRPLSPEHQRRLSASPTSRAVFQSVKEEFASRGEAGRISESVRAAAASSSESASTRRFPDGTTIEIAPSRRSPRRILAIITLDKTAAPPRALLVEGNDGQGNGAIKLIDLEAPDADRRIQLPPMSLDDPRDAATVQLLQDRRSVLTFLRQEPA